MKFNFLFSAIVLHVHSQEATTPSSPQFKPCPYFADRSPHPGGDCFIENDYFNVYTRDFDKKSFDEMSTNCDVWENYGGFLASIHSAEEEAFLRANRANLATKQMTGLKCYGKYCKWDDGSPLDYTNFDKDLLDDGKKRCMYLDAKNNQTWLLNDCSEQDWAYWECRYRRQNVPCYAYETPYGGGCISVRATPLNMSAAEADCQHRGGHLLSIHGNIENALKIAHLNGLWNAILLGGHIVDGKLQWTDGTYENYDNFVSPFPDTMFGECVQMMLYDQFGTKAGQWTNVPCSNALPYMCLRYGTDPPPTVPPPITGNACDGRAQFYRGSGTLMSPAFPVSITPNRTCEYELAVAVGQRVSLKFDAYDCGARTKLELFEGLDAEQPFITFDTKTAPNSTYTTEGNVMKIVFTSMQDPVGTGFEAEFHGIV